MSLNKMTNLIGFAVLMAGLNVRALTITGQPGAIINGQVVKDCFVQDGANGPKRPCDSKDHDRIDLAQKPIIVPPGGAVETGVQPKVPVTAGTSIEIRVGTMDNKDATVCQKDKKKKKKVCTAIPAEPAAPANLELDSIKVEGPGVAVTVPPSTNIAFSGTSGTAAQDDKLLPSNIYPEFKPFIDNELNQFLLSSSFLFIEHGPCQKKRDGDSIILSGVDCMVEVRLSTDESRRAVFHKFTELEFKRDKPSQPGSAPLKISFASEGSGTAKTFLKGYWQLTNSDELSLDLMSIDGIGIEAITAGESRIDNFNLF